MLHISVLTAIHPILASFGTISPPGECISPAALCEVEIIAGQVVNIVHEIVRLIPIRY